MTSARLSVVPIQRDAQNTHTISARATTSQPFSPSMLEAQSRLENTAFVLPHVPLPLPSICPHKDLVPHARALVVLFTYTVPTKLTSLQHRWLTKVEIFGMGLGILSRSFGSLPTAAPCIVLTIKGTTYCFHSDIHSLAS